MKACNVIGAITILSAAMMVAAPAQAQSLCVFDPMGAQGSLVQFFKDYAVAAQRWNATLDIKPYSDDQKLNDDFAAGRCDMAGMIGMRARQYNVFTGSIDAPGILQNYAAVRQLLTTMAAPQYAARMVSTTYEIDGVLPIGAGYALVNDRHINGLSTAAGHHAAFMAWDSSQAAITTAFHVVGVPAQLDTYIGLFKRHKVDIVVAPIALFAPVDMGKVVAEGGGLIRRPLFQFTMQLVAHNGRFPADFGQHSRQYMSAQVNRAIGLVRNDEAAVPDRGWIYASRADMQSWSTQMNRLINDQVKAGQFDGQMVDLMRKAECTSAPDDPACTPAGYALNDYR